MKITTNITNTSYDMERYSDTENVREFIKKHSLDGLELYPAAGNELDRLPADAVIGVHLSFFSCWVDFWHKNEEGVLSEFGTMDIAKSVLGEDRQAIIDRYKAQLDFAESLHAGYVVFHVADISLQESVTYSFKHTDTEVIDAALELINAVLDGSRYSFHFLVENLWWPGFTMTNPEMTRRLLDGIHHEKKGIMLDLGHLLHTNNNLTTQEDGVEYIHKMLDLHGALCGYIKGVHLQQSLTGAYVRSLIQNPPDLTGTYYERLGRIYEHIHQLDLHQPFIAKGIKKLIDRINPAFLTYEFITRSREEHDEFITAQTAALL